MRETEGRKNRETNKKQEGEGREIVRGKKQKERGIGNAPRKKTYLFSSL
jgi:hypothetical protein